jgi:hypothetical protein
MYQYITKINISIELLLQDDGNITQFVLLHVDTWLTQNVSIVDHFSLLDRFMYTLD